MNEGNICLSMTCNFCSRVAPPQFDGLVVFKGRGCDDVLGGVTCSAQNYIRVTLQLLNNLFRLQVPDVDQVVLGPGDDPLAPGDGEVSKDAILLVLVAAVRFQALAFAVVPEFEGVVEGGCEDVLAVRGELDKGDRGVVIVNKGLEALTWKAYTFCYERIVSHDVINVTSFSVFHTETTVSMVSETYPEW